jgi:selenocysteine lyase/cysteine desulfurase
MIRAMDEIRVYEKVLSLEMLRVLEDVGAEFYGIREPDRVSQRVPTFSFNLRNIPQAKVAQELVRNHLIISASAPAVCTRRV